MTPLRFPGASRIDCRAKFISPSALLFQISSAIRPSLVCALVPIRSVERLLSESEFIMAEETALLLLGSTQRVMVSL